MAINGIERLGILSDIKEKNFQPIAQNGVEGSIFPDKNNDVTLSPDAKAKLEEEYAAAAEAAGITEDGSEEQAIDAAASTSAATQTQATTNATGAVSSTDVKELDEERKKLEEEKKEKIEQMDKLEDKIEEKAEDAEDNIAKAKARQEDLVEEQQEEAEDATAKNVEEFKEANKDGKDGMTEEQLQENIAGDVEGAVDQTAAKSALTQATDDVAEMDGYLGELGNLITDAASIDQELNAIDQGEQAAAQAAQQQQCCDPIGFTMGEGENQVRYDFIKDDGSFDTTSDFLGAQGNWEEMAALDTDGDKVVTAKELEAGGIKAVKTGADGNKSVVGLNSEFGDDFSIDLNSYTQGGSHSAIDTSTGAQELMGTFNLNIAGESVSGYNTLDDTDFLESTYGVTNDIEAEDAETDNTIAQVSEEVQAHINFFETYTQKSEELKAEISAGFKNIGVTEEEIAEINENAKENAANKVNEFMQSIKPADETENEGEASEEGEDVTDTTNTQGAVDTDKAPAEPQEDNDIDTAIANSDDAILDEDEKLKLEEALAA